VSDGKCNVSSWEYPTYASPHATASAKVNGYSYPALVATNSTATVSGNLTVEKTPPPTDPEPTGDPCEGGVLGTIVIPTANYTASGEFSQNFVRNIQIQGNTAGLILLFSGVADASKSTKGMVSASSTVVYEIFTLMTPGSAPYPTPVRQQITKTCKAGDPTVTIAGGLTAPTAVEYEFSFSLKASGSGMGTPEDGGDSASSATFKYKLPN
jgi:hypothetical protein